MAAELGARAAVLDFVKPSPQGTVWGELKKKKKVRKDGNGMNVATAMILLNLNLFLLLFKKNSTLPSFYIAVIAVFRLLSP